MTSSASSTLTPLAHLPGHFYFTDLHTTDVDAACGFYAGMFGWQFDEIPGAPNRYVPARIDDRSKAAIGGLSEERVAAGTPSHWMPYLNVENVDATITRAQELGGTVTAEAVDVFDMGRMAVLTDPTVEPFGIWQDAQPGVTTVKDEHGSPFWYELHTSDLDAALAFYGGLVGWTTDAMQMGPDMTYHLIVPEHVDDVQTGVGGMMGQMQAAREAGAPSQWFSYFNVDDADAAFTKAQEHGARAVMEPHDIPGAGRSCWVEDPTGAQIAMMRPTPPTQAT